MDKIESFDIRVYERKVRNGEITRKEYEAYLQSIKECTDFTEIDEETLNKNAGIKPNCEEKSEPGESDNEQEKM